MFKSNLITTFGLICFIMLGVLLTFNFNYVLKTDNNNENLFYPILITLFLGVINLKIKKINN